MSGFLPISRSEMLKQGIDRFDYICVTGDAYVDHPSFGIAIISRVLEAQGYSVGILAQPDWHSIKDFKQLGEPRYGFFVTSGNIDSMVAHYSVAKNPRSEDSYSPGGETGHRPDRAVIVYCRMLRGAYPDTPIIIGGLEASLRRFAHYDYWDDAVRPSVLIDSGADLLVYGMGERQTVEISRRLAAGESVGAITDVPGTCYVTEPENIPIGLTNLPSFEMVSENKKEYCKAARLEIDEHDAVSGRALLQKHGKRVVIQNKPMPPLEQQELDRVYALPYMRFYHPSYEQKGGVPAIEEVEFSITHNRGCFGHCNFCSIAFHQGRKITCRSEDSVVGEAESFVANPRFKGYIHDVGGPTANFRRPSCKKQLTQGLCKGKKCLAPTPCPALEADHSEYLHMLRRLRAVRGVKKVFIRSGIRFDYLLEDKNDAFFNELIENHVSGQLKVAPEHCSPTVLDAMGKPHIEAYEAFEKRFYERTKRIHKEQYLVPYLMSSHPGSTLKDAVTLALFLKKHNIRPEQVQDFYPTPGTISTCMFYTGLDPYTLKPVFVPRTSEEKAMQRALLQYFNPNNHVLVVQALKKAGREDLIGYGEACLIPPYIPKKPKPQGECKTQYRPAAPHSGGRAGAMRQKAAPPRGGKGELHGKTTRPTGAKAPKRPV